MDHEDFPTRFWRFLNPVIKLIGKGFLIGGIYLTLWMVYLELIEKPAARLFYLPFRETGMVLITIGFPIVCAVLGLLIIRAEPYYPPPEG